MSEEEEYSSSPSDDIFINHPTNHVMRVPTPSSSPNSTPAVVLVSAGYDHTIRFWDVVQGLCIGVLQHNESHVNCLAISRNKLLLATGGNPAVRLYDTMAALRISPEQQLTTGASHQSPLHVFDQGQKGNVVAVGFASEGDWLWSVSEEGIIRIWDLGEGFICRKELEVGPLTTAVLHPNQEELVIGDEEGRIRIIRLDTSLVIGELRLDSCRAIRDVAISSDGSLLAAIDHKGGLHVWCLLASSSPTSIHSDISLTSAGEPLRDDESSTVKSSPAQKSLARATTKLSLASSIPTAHLRYGIKCMFSPDSSRLLSTSADGLAKLWQISRETNVSNEQPQLELVQQFEGHHKWVWDCTFSADSAYIITASSDESLRLWDVRTAETVAVYSGHSKAVTCVALNDLPIT